MNNCTNIALYAGSFDPVTFGHLWLIREASCLFNNLIIAIGQNPQKTCSFDLNTRMNLLQYAIKDYSNVEIKILDNEFLINYAMSINIKYIIRGIRNTEDYEYEKMMRYINSDICDEVQTLFLIPPRKYAEVSSNLIKGLVGSKGWQSIASKYVPVHVIKALEQKFQPNDN